ncbi:MAG: hypothetical protein M3347_00650, partial [Armatimonadota bacterium]|nr:hypothetical protein [Armatimonadota bacterium]
NDLTDLQDDRASGKENRLFAKSPIFITLLLACCILPGIAVALHWRHDPLLLSFYLAAWTAFSLYSIPPIRLKNRGILGIVADASGAHLLPTLLVVSLVFRWRGHSLDLIWFTAVAVWSLCYGLRGILWHQLSDLQNDEKIGLHTFVQGHNITLAQRLGNFIIFPLEMVAFAVMLWHAGSRLSIAFLFLYALLEWLRKRLLEVNLVIVVPQAQYQIVMQEYYEVFYPLAFLLSSSLQHPRDAFIIVVHFLLFPRRAAQSLKDSGEIIRRRNRLF